VRFRTWLDSELRRLRRQDIGIKQVDEHIWLVNFMDYDLG
jgi:hypothetical protein